MRQLALRTRELEMNCVCTLGVEGTIKSMFRHLPVLKTEVGNKNSEKYNIAIKHGFLKGAF